MENKKDKNQEVVVELNIKNTEKLKSLLQQQKLAEQLLNDYITTVLDTKEVDYANREVKINEDFTKIIITGKVEKDGVN